MSQARLIHQRSTSRPARRRALHPLPEALEDRLLLYSDLGDQWTYGSHITYSLVPDGTNVGGVPSALFQTLNKNYPTGQWEQQIQYAASLWENVTGVNMVQVGDGGEPIGTSGDQQGDPRFGDIRIGDIPLAAGTLAETFLPPPANGGTVAGDIFLNSNINWQIGSNYDLMTVMTHEFGHALGLGESTVSTAVMYGTYNGIKQALTSDDIAGIDSIYGTRPFDQFNDAGTRDNTYSTATNINAYINSAAQIAIPRLDITTAGDSEWFYVNVPATTSGRMSVTVQSANLSSLTPELQVYSSSFSLVGQSAAPIGSFGTTVSVSASVTSGQGYYIKVLAAGGPGPVGSYALLVNFGSQSQALLGPPNTVVPQQPNQVSGGAIDNAVTVGSTDLGGGNGGAMPPINIMAGNLLGVGWNYAVTPGTSISPASPVIPPSNPIVITPTSPTQRTGSAVSTVVPISTPSPSSVPSPLKVLHKKHVKQEVKPRKSHVHDTIKIKHHHLA